MHYTTEQIEEMALEAIEEHNIAFFDRVQLFIPVTSKTLYNHKIHELQTIKEALEFNKVSRKEKIIQRWEDSDNATLSIAAVKLLLNEEEYNRLATIKQDIKTNDKPIIIFRNASAEDKEESDIKADDGGD
jgi:hypothetical protein